MISHVVHTHVRPTEGSWHACMQAGRRTCVRLVHPSFGARQATAIDQSPKLSQGKREALPTPSRRRSISLYPTRQVYPPGVVVDLNGSGFYKSNPRHFVVTAAEASKHFCGPRNFSGASKKAWFEVQKQAFFWRDELRSSLPPST